MSQQIKPTTEFSVKSFEKQIYDALDTQIKALKEKIVTDAVAAFEKDLRTAVGQVAIQLADYYSVEMRGGELLIHVKIERPQ